MSQQQHYDIIENAHLKTEQKADYIPGVGRLRKWGSGAPGSSDTGVALGGIYTDTATGKRYKNTGTSSSPTWTEQTISTTTLDEAFDQGKTITGADSRANAMAVGDGTSKIELYELAGVLYIGGTDATGDHLKIIPEGDLYLIPEGGTVIVTGNMTISGTLEVLGALAFDSIVGEASKTFAISAGASNQKLTLDASGSGVIEIGLISTGNIAIGDANNAKVTVDSLTAIELTSTLIDIAGNCDVSGDLDVTGTLTVGTFAPSSFSGATFTFTATTETGVAFSIIGDAMTSGTGLLISADDSSWAGNYIVCDDGGSTKFSIGTDGSIGIAGTTSGSDAIAITAGDITLTAGHVDLVVGSVQLTDGNFTSAIGYVQVTNSADEGNFFKRTVASAGTLPVVEIESTHDSSTKECLLLDSNGTASQAMIIDHEGSADCFTITTACAGASGIKVTTEAVTGTAIELACVASTTVPMVVVDGLAGNWVGAVNKGMIDMICDGALAQISTSMIRVAFSGAPAQPSSLGTAISIIDTGSVNTASAFYISSSTGIAATIAGAGAVDTFVVTSAANSASAIKVTTSHISGTALEIITAASSIVNGVQITSGGADATGWLGAAGKGMLSITNVGDLADATASCLKITYGGTPAATTLGTALSIIDTCDVATAASAYISTGASSGHALKIAAGATAADSITITSAATSASAIKAVMSIATGTVLEAEMAASATVPAITLTCTGGTSTGWLGAQNVGMLHIADDGDLDHVDASLVYIANSGTAEAQAMGTSLRINDSTTDGGATSFAVYIAASAIEALNVAVGKSLFAEELAVAAGTTINFDGIGGATTIAETGGLLSFVGDGDMEMHPSSDAGGVVTIGDLEVGGTGALAIKGDDDSDHDVGVLILYDHAGVPWYYWAEDDGTLRVHTTYPADQGVTGTVVGDQTE